jgi:hypothetical protein
MLLTISERLSSNSSEFVIELGKNYYSLTGDIDLIRNKHRAKSNFESYGASFNEGNKIIIPFSTD